jgi:long-chain fatty acid transport protein
MRESAAPFASLALALGVILAVAALPPSLGAQDLAFHEVGARAASLGGAFTAKADDLSAIYYNPAGLAFLKGLRIKTNLLVANRTVNAFLPERDVTVDSDPREYLQNVFLSWRPAKRIGLGLGIFSPYNFRAQWLDPWWTGNAVSTSSRLRAQYLRPALAVEVLKGLSLGAALDYVIVTAAWDHTVAFSPANNTQELPDERDIFSRHELSGHGLGFAAGALWTPLPSVRIGVRFQSETTVNLHGSNSFAYPQAYYWGVVSSPFGGAMSSVSLLDLFYASQFVTGRLTMPREIACGVALTPLRPVSLFLDLEWDTWSRLGDWEFTSVNADEDLSPGFTPAFQEFWGIAPDYGTQGAPLALRDTMGIKAGAEWRLGRWFAVRAGFARQESSAATTDLGPVYPDLARTVYSLGGGYEGPLFSIYDTDETIGQLSLDVALRYSPATAVVSTLPGLEFTYSSRRWVISIGVGFNF